MTCTHQIFRSYLFKQYLLVRLLPHCMLTIKIYAGCSCLFSPEKSLVWSVCIDCTDIWSWDVFKKRSRMTQWAAPPLFVCDMSLETYSHLSRRWTMVQEIFHFFFVMVIDPQEACPRLGLSWHATLVVSLLARDLQGNRPVINAAVSELSRVHSLF